MLSKNLVHKIAGGHYVNKFGDIQIYVTDVYIDDIETIGGIQLGNRT